jgi:magnesium transporter
LGVVYSDDVIDLLGESPAATLYSFAGVEATERPFDSAWKKIRHRYRWLIINLITVFLAGGVVALFEDTLEQIVLLAVYLPIVAGMGSNAATQTLAVMVRGIAIGEITLRNSRAALVREIVAALINGVITGFIVFLVAVILNQNPLFGLVAGISVVASLVVAGFFGTIFPLLLRHMGKDPATSAGILITTTTDILGFFVLLGLATLLLL